jgi:hypothetical protein
MASPNSSDLTYSEFVKRRAAALSQLHRAQELASRILDSRYTPFSAAAAELAQHALADAQQQLVQVIDLWAQSKFNRSV